MYEVGVPMPRPNLLLDISALRERKQQAMACFVSQLTEQPYDQHITALNRFRTYTLNASVTAAEAYFLADAASLKTDILHLYESEHQRQSGMGLPMTPADVPLVSVLIRSMNRHTLKRALDSVALQTYSNIEVVVVNAKGDMHQSLGDWCGSFPLRLTENLEALQRSRAANAALKDAKGKYLIFLDDDDWFAPHHVDVLVSRIQQEDGVQAVHSNIQVVDAKGSFELYVFKDAFDPVRMMADNLLPIHSVLFDHDLIAAGCHFDESFDAYEDWDFWLQVSKHTKISHVEKVGAYYAALGASEVGLQGEDHLRKRARELVFEKWKTIWDGKQINALLEQKDSLVRGKSQELESTVQKLTNETALAIHTIEERTNTSIQGLESRLKVQAEILFEKVSLTGSLNRNLIESEFREAELTRRIDELITSKSWNVTRPLRWLGMRVRSVRHLLALTNRFVEVNGGGFKGFSQLFFKSLSVIRRHGPVGLLYKTKSYARHAGEKASTFNPAYPISTFTPMMQQGVAPHGHSVDIIVCIHNALEDVKRCLQSVLSHTLPPYSLILVDDGSNEPTRIFLEEFASGQRARLIRNATAKGYTLAANQGLRSSTSDYVVLLNSDTIVSLQWLDRLIMCAESDTLVGIVGPLSNTASWQSIPELIVNGDWANNDLPDGVTIPIMASLVASQSARLYPRIPLLNGFCLLLKRKLIEQIGIFDEESFAQGYGEENDYCLRARAVGWSLAIADDVYVYHAQSKSYSHEKRRTLSQRAGEILAQKHGQLIIDESVSFCINDRVLQGMRASLKQAIFNYLSKSETKFRWEAKRVLFFLPTADAGGGSNVVISEALALISMGVDACLVNYTSNQSSFEYSYPTISIPRVYVSNDSELRKLACEFDAVIATVNTTVHSLAALATSTSISPNPVIGYYVQDFEPMFYEEGSRNYIAALHSYGLIKGMQHLTKTYWNQQILQEKTGVNSIVIGPSFDASLFRPRPRQEVSWPDRPLRIVAMVRPNTPRRAPLLTMQVLRDAYRKYGQKIDIVLFGEESENPDFLALPRDFNWRNLGKQTSSQLALLFNESDIFVDFSEYQAMGLTALEAMACGVAVIVPQKGGAASFAVHEKNALFVDSSSHTECMITLSRLIENADLRTSIQQHALVDVTQFIPHVAATKMMQALFPYTALDREKTRC